MEAKYENSEMLRLEVLNAMIALGGNIGLNCNEVPKGIMVAVIRENDETVTEYLSRAEIEQAIKKRISELEKEIN